MVTWVMLLAALESEHPAQPPKACAAFVAKREAFEATLIRTEGAPPRSDPLASPPAATALGSAAEACLRERGVAFKARAGAEGLVVDAAGTTLPRTNGVRFVYSTRFFLERPYAAASFDEPSLTLYLPHEFITGESGRALEHEGLHVASWLLTQKQWRWRAARLTNARTSPNSLHVDECFVYRHQALAGQGTERGDWASRQGEHMVALLRETLTDETTTVQRTAHSVARPLDAAARAELARVAQCLSAATTVDALEACDGPETPPRSH